MKPHEAARVDDENTEEPAEVEPEVVQETVESGEDQAVLAEARLPLTGEPDLVVRERQVILPHGREHARHGEVGLRLVGPRLGDPSEQMVRLAA